MTHSRFTLVFILTVIAQILLNVFCNFTPLISISMLPMLILMLPVGKSTTFALLLSFVTGLVVDFLSTGTLGLTSIALLPVAAMRQPILRLVFGEEIFSRRENVSIARQGWPKMSVAIAFALLLYFIVSVLFDSSFSRSFGFSAGRILLSVIVSVLLCLLIVGPLTEDH